MYDCFMLCYIDNMDSLKCFWFFVNFFFIFYVIFFFGFFNKIMFLFILFFVVFLFCVLNFFLDYLFEILLEWILCWWRVLFLEMLSCMELLVGGWVVFLDMGGVRGILVEVGIGVEDEGFGLDIFWRVWSIFLWVDLVREVMLLIVRLVVGIGGSIIIVVSYIV